MKDEKPVFQGDIVKQRDSKLTLTDFNEARLRRLSELENFIELRSIIKSQAISAGISNWQRFIFGVEGKRILI